MKLFLLGGFLGSGKTTAIQQACAWLKEKNIPTGVITNDQGVQLVDSAFLKGLEIPNREVVNGCFCCHYADLEKAILSFWDTAAPEILFAESVGSCTDIVATVIKPLLNAYPELEIVYSVFADARNILKIIKGDPVFEDEDVNYIFEKQLEEADLLIANKTDLLSEQELQEVKRWSERYLSGRSMMYQDSLKKEDIEKWLLAQRQFQPGGERKSLQINYKKYGAGEAKLAWLDETLSIAALNDNAVELAQELINKMYGKIKQKKYPIGHLKFLIQSGQWQRKISFTSLHEPLLKQTRQTVNFNTVTLLVNARISARPDQIKQILTNAVGEMVKDHNCKIDSKQSAAFQPKFPIPEQRIE